MPHVSSGGGDDLASTDEVKVYRDEGEEEERSSENLLSDDKLGLVTETEEEKGSSSIGPNFSKEPQENGHGKEGSGSGDPRLGGPLHGYVVAPYPYPNGASFPGSLGGKVSMVQPGPHGHGHALSQLMAMYSSTSDHHHHHPLSQPPPAHMGIPPVHIDPKTGMARHMLFPHPSLSPHLYSPDLSQVQWHHAAGYPTTSGAFRGAYPPSLISNTGPLGRFPAHPGMLPHHPGIPGLPHPAIITPGPKQEIHPSPEARHSFNESLRVNNENNNNHDEKPKKNHIKKPLNAFMLFMKEQRAKVVAECTLKESAAINQILGRKWHALDRSEQAKYYDMARKEKELHQQLYPGWSARDNYATHTKRKKRKRECQGENKDCNNPKKCRARFGLDQQGQWCKPCRRKKKCIRFLTDGDDDEGLSTDNEMEGEGDLEGGEDVEDIHHDGSPGDIDSTIDLQMDCHRSHSEAEEDDQDHLNTDKGLLSPQQFSLDQSYHQSNSNIKSDRSSTMVTQNVSRDQSQDAMLSSTTQMSNSSSSVVDVSMASTSHAIVAT